MAAELADYLPLSFKTPKEQEYIEFLWDAFETNHTHGKYQFAFLAYHMLTMSFVYFNIWQIKQTCPADFEKGQPACDTPAMTKRRPPAPAARCTWWQSGLSARLRCAP